jgi:hypothetical protein
MTKQHKRPCFSSASAKLAQPLALVSRRANDARMRAELAKWLPLMSETLRASLVERLGQHAVDALVVAARTEAEQ